jgi:hypothetical protein
MRTHTTKPLLLALLVLISSTLPTAAQLAPEGAWPGVTLLLQDGWRFRDVTVYLDADGAGLWILRTDGAERLVSPDQVARIIDGEGQDITQQVLGGLRSPRTRSDTPPPLVQPYRQDPEPTGQLGWDGTYEPTDRTWPEPPSKELPFKLGLGVEGGFAMPAGDWYSGVEGSWFVGGKLRTVVHERSYFSLGARYQDLGSASLYPDGYSDFSAHILMLEATFGWMSPTSPRSRTLTYFELGVAMLQNEVQVSSGDDDYKASDSTGSFLLRTGVLMPLGQNTALDLGVSWSYRGLIFSDDYEPNGSILGAHLGVVLLN